MPTELASVPYTEIERLLAAGPLVAVLPVGATEAHGPHLPLNTDVIISQAFGRRAAELIESSGRASCALLPAMAYTPADYASSFPGTISIRWETAANLIRDIALNLKRQGFACLAIANSHFDPANTNVLRSAAIDITETGLPVAFADATRRSLATRLTAEFQSGDCHGGRFETSILLAAEPALVLDDQMRRLPSVEAGLIQAVTSGDAQVRFETVGMARAYCGSPALATPEEGQNSIETLAAALSDTVLALL